MTEKERRASPRCCGDCANWNRTRELSIAMGMVPTHDGFCSVRSENPDDPGDWRLPCNETDSCDLWVVMPERDEP